MVVKNVLYEKSVFLNVLQRLGMFVYSELKP